MNRYKVKYFHAGKTATIIIKAKSKEEARNIFYINFLGADVVTIQEDKYGIYEDSTKTFGE